MNNKNKLISMAGNFQLLFRYIKNDDINNFLKLVDNNPELIFFKNKQKENILFYALQKGSIEIADYLMDNYQRFMYEKNRYALTPFSNLIYTNNIKGLTCLSELAEKHQDKIDIAYDINGEQYNLPLLAVLKLGKDGWNCFTKLTNHLWKEDSLSLQNADGYNIAHLIAKRNATYCLNILDKANKDIFQKKEFLCGDTPFLIACYLSNKTIVEKFKKFSDIHEINASGNTALHLAASREKTDILQLLLKSNLDAQATNFNSDSILSTAINCKNENNINLLYPLFKGKDISEEVLLLIKKMPKNIELISKILSESSDEELFSILNSKEKTKSLFNYIFYYFNEEQIETLQQKNIWNYIYNINEPLDMHSLYTAAIMGRKSMSSKISILHSISPFISVEDSELFFKPLLLDGDLYFENQHENHKQQKSFCLVSALGTLPVSQINDILIKTDILNKFSEGDLALLYSIGIKKNSTSLLGYLEQLPKPYIVKDSNLDWAIQENLSYFNIQFINNDIIQKAFKHTVNLFTHSPVYFIHNISNEISEENKDLVYLKTLFSILNKTEFKKEITTSIMTNMLNKENNSPVLEKLFSTNSKIIHYFLNNLQYDSLTHVKDNNFYNLLLKSYSKLYSPLNLCFSFIQSDNVEKNNLVENTLQYIDSNETKLNKALIEKSLSISINDDSWRTVLNHFHTNPHYYNLIDLYFEHQSKFLSSTNIETIKIATQFAKHVDINKVIDNLAYTCDVNEDNQEKLKCYINLINPQKNQNIYLDLAKSAINKSNFNLVNFLCDNYNINLEKINLDSYWFTPDLQINFSIDILNSKYKPLESYIDFLVEHKEKFSLQFWENNSYNLAKWLETHPADTETKTKIISLFFNSTEEFIYHIPNEVIISICLSLLKNHNNKLIPLLSNIKNNSVVDSMEETLDLFFNNKEDKFFIELNKNLTLNTLSLPLKQQKEMSYYLLKETIAGIEVKKENKKKLKI